VSAKKSVGFVNRRGSSGYCTLLCMKGTYYTTDLLGAAPSFGGSVRHELNVPGE
jgi:hypothetical protein